MKKEATKVREANAASTPFNYLELEKTKKQLKHYKLKAIKYKKKYLDLEKKCIRAKYRATYDNLKRKLHLM
ncbi:hypothetical protein RUND412_003230 [Rhizina undulata]